MDYNNLLCIEERAEAVKMRYQGKLLLSLTLVDIGHDCYQLTTQTESRLPIAIVRQLKGNYFEILSGKDRLIIYQKMLCV